MNRVPVYIFLMALTTYLIRVLPLVLFKKEIKSNFFKSFLYYVPFVCLSAMTFPAILSSTQSVNSAIGALTVALVAAYREKSLLSVALLACLSVFLIERIIHILYIREGLI